MILLQQSAILADLSDDIKNQIEAIELFESLDSTNQYLLNKPLLDPQLFQICLTEQQTSGRGRRGRKWVSPTAANCYLSLSKKLTLKMSEAAGLSILTALAVVKVIRQFDIDAGLKWPNDIYAQGKKLAGILLEVIPASNQQIKVVIGIGINVDMPTDMPEIDQPWIDMQQAHKHHQTIDRNRLSAILIEQLIHDIADYEKNHLLNFYPQWQQYDIWFNQTVCVQSADHQISGINKGIHTDGCLCLLVDDKIKYFHAGEVSLRSS